MNEKLNVILTELQYRFKALYGSRLTHLILYGSQARGDAEPGSDIDVMVVLEGPVNPFEEIHHTGKIVAELSLEHNEVIACVFILAEQFECEQTPLLINVHREGISDWSSLQTKTVLPGEYNIQETREVYRAIAEVDQGSLEKLEAYAPTRSPIMTPHQLMLLRKAVDSLNAAKLLADQGYYDFAASRAYYTMFYGASALLLGEGFTFSKHSTVIALFGQHFAKTGRVPVEFHQYLIEAMKVRPAGDYGTIAIDKAEAAKQITRTEQFLQLAERLIGPISPADTSES
jgi:uncharacterized protein (UPF0332 family)/predicted nucleotidyltransferase